MSGLRDACEIILIHFNRHFILVRLCGSKERAQSLRLISPAQSIHFIQVRVTRIMITRIRPSFLESSHACYNPSNECTAIHLKSPLPLTFACKQPWPSNFINHAKIVTERPVIVSFSSSSRSTCRQTALENDAPRRPPDRPPGCLLHNRCVSRKGTTDSPVSQL